MPWYLALNRSSIDVGAVGEPPVGTESSVKPPARPSAVSRPRACRAWDLRKSCLLQFLGPLADPGTRRDGEQGHVITASRTADVVEQRSPPPA